MARFVQAYRKSLTSISNILIPQLHPHEQHQFSLQPNKPISYFLAQFSRNHSTVPKPPFESNILHILHNEIEYLSEYAPLLQPDTKFEAFTVEDQPGENWVTLKSKSAGDENIKLEATMFDGYNNTGSDLKLHISLLVDISKGDRSDVLEFVCSAWPDCLEIQKVYIFRRDGTLAKPYTGPKFCELDKKLQSALYEFLKARGVHDNLSSFLHEYMMNKDKIELIQWFGNLKSFLDK